MSDTKQQHGQAEVNANTKTGSDDGTSSTDVIEPPSPGVDVHALLGIPRVKRPSEISEEQDDSEGSDSDDLTDSDDDELEELQEGEYLVMEDTEESKELQTQVMAEQADLHRQVLLPVFKACTTAYDRWMEENKNSLPESEMKNRKCQLQLYRKVLELYGSDDSWAQLAHGQKISKDTEVLELSERAKDMGPPPDVVSDASVAAGRITEKTAGKREPVVSENANKSAMKQTQKLSTATVAV